MLPTQPVFSNYLWELFKKPKQPPGTNSVSQIKLLAAIILILNGVIKLSLLQQVLNLLYPPKCASCGASAGHFCEDCQAKLVRIGPPFCQKCGCPLNKSAAACSRCDHNPLPYLDSVRSVALFEGTPLRPAIHNFKYHNQRILGQDFAPLLAKCYRDNQLETEVIVPVPLHSSRYKERGYNQSELLANGLAALINQPVDKKTLIRRRATKTQVSLSAAERHKNVAEAFACISNALSHKSVLLIDDVCTTGATLNACAQALKRAKARSVYGLTLAQAY